MIYTCRYASPLGGILLAADDVGLTGLWFTENQRHLGEGLSPEAVERPSPYFDAAVRWLDVYFTGRDPGFTPPLHLTGTEFRNRVGEILLEIPYGETTTYGEIARRVAEARGLAKMSSRAVGGAVGRNPISLIVPCHRVLGTATAAPMATARVTLMASRPSAVSYLKSDNRRGLSPAIFKTRLIKVSASYFSFWPV